MTTTSFPARRTAVKPIEQLRQMRIAPKRFRNRLRHFRRRVLPEQDLRLLLDHRRSRFVAGHLLVHAILETGGDAFKVRPSDRLSSPCPAGRTGRAYLEL